jgi:hypothetical protein
VRNYDSVGAGQGPPVINVDGPAPTES